MEQSIASLSPEQAQRALMIFYDLLPDDFWEDGHKPSTAEIGATADELQEDSPADVKPLVEALLADGGAVEKGAAAEVLLALFYEQDSLRGFVEQATEQAMQPHMSPIPLLIGAVVVLLSGVRLKVGRNGVEFNVGVTGNVKSLVEGVKSLADKLPTEVFKKIFGVGA